MMMKLRQKRDRSNIKLYREMCLNALTYFMSPPLFSLFLSLVLTLFVQMMLPLPAL